MRSAGECATPQTVSAVALHQPAKATLDDDNARLATAGIPLRAAAVPEPATLALIAGELGLVDLRRGRVRGRNMLEGYRPHTLSR
jgi:hypothetical protein